MSEEPPKSPANPAEPAIEPADHFVGDKDTTSSMVLVVVAIVTVLVLAAGIALWVFATAG